MQNNAKASEVLPLLIQENQLAQNSLLESNSNESEDEPFKGLQKRKKSLLSNISTLQKDQASESIEVEEEGQKNTLAEVFLRGCSFDEQDANDSEF